jgi:hypothetical protein
LDLGTNKCVPHVGCHDNLTKKECDEDEDKSCFFNEVKKVCEVTYPKRIIHRQSLDKLGAWIYGGRKTADMVCVIGMEGLVKNIPIQSALNYLCLNVNMEMIVLWTENNA